MSSSCTALLGALKACLLESDCVQKHGRLPSECLKHHTDELPEACQNLRKATYECKRNMLDMQDISKHLGHMTQPVDYNFTRSLLSERNQSDMSKSLLLYTAPTPNGHKVSILLEELKAVYGDVVDYDVEKIVLSSNRQKEPWFIALNPNGRIPVLVDREHRPEPFNIFESAAILLYLVRKYDTKGLFSFPAGSDDESVMLQWIFFAHGGVGPMQGQAHHFRHYAPEDIPYGKKRYMDETARLYNVLNIRLEGREYLAGPGKGKLSIADINVLPWVRLHQHAGIDTLDAFPNTKAWVERLVARPGVLAGLQVP